MTVLGLLVAGGPLAQHSDADPPATGPDRPAATGLARPAAPALRLVADRKPELRRWKGHPGRVLLRYRVRPGDTATGLAVRYHAWTAELLTLNHLGRRSVLHVGDRLRIPIVVAAARGHGHPPGAERHGRSRHAKADAKTNRPNKPNRRAPKAAENRKPQRAHSRWRGADASRTTVRRVVVRTARRHGVNPYLALAVAWQESGWQQRRVSSAGALGVMQVLPGTGEWMEMYVGSQLHLRRLRDNVTAGVVLLDVLRDHTGRRRAVGAYYQGLGSVQRYGLSQGTRHYVRNVLALEQRLRNGWNPA